jgi:hypothetical protein
LTHINNLFFVHLVEIDADARGRFAIGQVFLVRGRHGLEMFGRNQNSKL